MDEVDITLEVVTDSETGETAMVRLVGPSSAVQQVVDACMSEDTEVSAELVEPTEEGAEDE